MKHEDREIFKTAYKTRRASPRFRTVPREFLGQLGAVVSGKPSDFRSGHVSVSDFGVDRKEKTQQNLVFHFWSAFELQSSVATTIFDFSNSSWDRRVL